MFNEYEPKLVPNRWTLYGHAVAELMVEVLDRSGRSLNREIAISSANVLDTFPAKNLTFLFIFLLFEKGLQIYEDY